MVGNWRESVKKICDPQMIKKAMAFGQLVCDEIKERGQEILEKENDLDEKQLIATI